MHKQGQSKVRAGGRQRGYQKAGRVKANGQSSINSPGYKQGKHTQGKRSEMSDGAKQEFVMREMKSKAYKTCLTECSCVISANE